MMQRNAYLTLSARVVGWSA